MNKNRCYTNDKSNCEPQYCDVLSGKCIKKTKGGKPYKTKLDTELGSSYYYDEKYGLVGTEKSVKAYIEEIKKSGEKSTKTSHPKTNKPEKRNSDIQSDKSLKEIQRRIDDIMSGGDISPKSFVKSKSVKNKPVEKSLKTQHVNKLTTSPKSPHLLEKKLRDYSSVIGLVDGECYG